jgi:hypothetical protein
LIGGDPASCRRALSRPLGGKYINIWTFRPQAAAAPLTTLRSRNSGGTLGTIVMSSVTGCANTSARRGPDRRHRDDSHYRRDSQLSSTAACFQCIVRALKSTRQTTYGNHIGLLGSPARQLRMVAATHGNNGSLPLSKCWPAVLVRGAGARLRLAIHTHLHRSR